MIRDRPKNTASGENPPDPEAGRRLRTLHGLDVFLGHDPETAELFRRRGFDVREVVRADGVRVFVARVPR